ncbi:hypothetical protein ABPG72_016223 [Tetrahymena utriculariae]
MKLFYLAFIALLALCQVKAITQQENLDMQDCFNQIENISCKKIDQICKDQAIKMKKCVETCQNIENKSVESFKKCLQSYCISINKDAQDQINKIAKITLSLYFSNHIYKIFKNISYPSVKKKNSRFGPPPSPQIKLRLTQIEQSDTLNDDYLQGDKSQERQKKNMKMYYKFYKNAEKSSCTVSRTQLLTLFSKRFDTQFGIMKNINFEKVSEVRCGTLYYHKCGNHEKYIIPIQKQQNFEELKLIQEVTTLCDSTYYTQRGQQNIWIYLKFRKVPQSYEVYWNIKKEIRPEQFDFANKYLSASLSRVSLQQRFSSAGQHKISVETDYCYKRQKNLHFQNIFLKIIQQELIV